MKIQLTKLNHDLHRLAVVRGNGLMEQVELPTAVFLLHDLTHYVVERALQYNRGFWGLLALGHSFIELQGKVNPLTEALRLIEKIVGPVQSAYMGHFPAAFVAEATAHLNYPLPGRFAEAAVVQIAGLEQDWQRLPFGGTLELEFPDN